MKILVIGSGGREHALCHKLAENPANTVYCAPGNAGTATEATNIPIGVDDIAGLKAFALKEAVDLTVVGPEGPLVAGIVDEFQDAGLAVFGPDASSARLEGSKAFTKEFLERYKIPTATYGRFTDPEAALRFLDGKSYPVVVKADGLCAGKGVIIAENRNEAKDALRSILVDRQFGDEGSEVVIEEFLRGYESSYFAIASQGKLFPLGSAKDYKQIGEGDTGLNTGGVGAFSPNLLMDETTTTTILEQIIPAIEAGLLAEDLKFTGVLFIGFMITEEGPKVLEFNVRFGDPETQVLLPRVTGDLAVVLRKAVDGTLEQADLNVSDRVAMTVILCSGGYPETYETGKPIAGLDDVEPPVFILHNGTVNKDGAVLTAGGRVLSVISTGETLEQCREDIYKNIEKIHFENNYFRKDIAKTSCTSA